MLMNTMAILVMLGEKRHDEDDDGVIVRDEDEL